MEAQLKFIIKPDVLKRLDHFVATEGSDNYVNALFEIEDDANIIEPTLAVFVRIEDEVYMIPKDKESGLYSIPSYVILYPGFSIFCKIYSGDVVKITEEVPVKVRGNGNIIKRVLKTTEEFSLETVQALLQRCIDLEARVEELEYIINHLGIPAGSDFNVYLIDDNPNPPDEPDEPTQVDDEVVLYVGGNGNLSLDESVLYGDDNSQDNPIDDSSGSHIIDGDGPVDDEIGDDLEEVKPLPKDVDDEI